MLHQKQDVLKLSKIADDGEVQIYTAKKLEMLQVFTNLHMYTSNIDESKDTTNDEEEESSNENIGWTVGYTPEDKSTGLSTAYLGYRFYWNKPESGEDLQVFELGAVEQRFGIFTASAGAYAQNFTTFNFKKKALVSLLKQILIYQQWPD